MRLVWRFLVAIVLRSMWCELVAAFRFQIYKLWTGSDHSTRFGPSWSAIRLLSASAGGSRFSSYVKCGVTVLMATRSDWLMWALAVELRQAKMAWIWAEQLSKLRRERSCWNGEAAAEAKSWVLSGFSAGSVQPLIAFHQPREFNFLRIGLYNFSILNVYSICRSPPRKMYPQIELVGLHLD
ncbi:hypothetical protein CASFOL_000127 [Castilleja foliolosa]|uniref:Secreted protein n=1 Tax=Castilleja foliolosa TaxID=1961234 RepID=A0ABD3ENB7_9LAMI